MADFETILTERRGDVQVLTINRPERLNAAPPLTFDEIRAALSELGGARAVLLTGAGRAFCSGADVAGGSITKADPPQATFEALSKSYNPTMLAIAELPVPIVAAVRGPAAGIGASLALACDFVVASETGYFLEAFANIGLVPDGGASWMLPRMIGKARAMEMALLGERVPADKALAWGLIHQVVADDALDATAFALATRLAAGPTRALGLSRRAMNAALTTDYQTALAREASDQREAMRGPDAAEGARAFLEKRKAVFSGG